MTLKLSQFTVPLHDYPQAGKHILYNTLTRAMSSIGDNGWHILQGLPSVPNDNDGQKWLETLKENGFVVPLNADEGKLYIQRLEKAKQNTDHLHVTLSLIQGCNFGCSYCYQGGRQSTHDGAKITESGIPGSLKTGEIITFLKLQCQERNVKKLHFTAYGGEPLLNKPALLSIVKAMQTHCRQQGIQWSFGMVSNGSLLTRKTTWELKKYGLVQVQVTIDGNKETHDASRPFLKVKGKDVSTYDLIMQNLEGWAGLIHTDVLCVVSESNLSAAHELIDTLADLGLAEKHVRMMFSPISPTYDDKTLEEVTHRFANNPELLQTELEIVDAITKLEIHAAKRGLIDDLRPRGKWCAVIRANGQNVTITPEGKLYSCALFLGRGEKYETGHILKTERGGLDTLMKDFEYPDECKKCTYLPICANCRADSLEKKGDLLGANSHKARYDFMLPQLIKAHYDLINRQIGS
jgi:uncharacterized protein